MDFLRLVTILITFLQLFLRKINCEYFTSVVALETLIRTKDEVVKALDVYLKAEAERLKKVEIYKEEYKRMFENEASDVQEIVTNPLNAYLLIKMLTVEWRKLRQLLISSESAMNDALDKQSSVEFPDEDDLTGAVVGLIRLQKMYKLSTTTLANGYILGAKSRQFSADDCYEIGRQMMTAEDYEHCAQWMKEALFRFDKELDKTVSREEILEALAYSMYKKENLKEALRITEELLELVPDHPRANGNKEYYDYVLSKENGNVTDENGICSSETELERYQSLSQPLCRGEKILTAGEESKLKCHYSYGANPYFVLQPFKVEELLLDPQILLYHEFLNDKEMDTVMSLAIPRLSRAAVATTKDEDDFIYSDHRISKIAWLRDDDHSTIRKISERIEGATGLTLSTAEHMQVLNYGIGGHYEVHLDFAHEGEFPALREKYGDRIATWLNYMTNVDAGGNTVFPEIGVAVKPEKGSAVLWFNLLKNGTGDVRTIHTACPVLLGSKWVSNKWIHERGQEFLRKCGLRNE